MIEPKRRFMEEVIKQAKIARKEGDYAVGSVIIKDDKIVSLASNRCKRDEDPIAHAETLAILNASKKLNSRHLTNCIL